MTVKRVFGLEWRTALLFLLYVLAISLLYAGIECLSAFYLAAYPHLASQLYLLKAGGFILLVSTIMYILLRQWQRLFQETEKREAQQQRQIRAVEQFTEQIIDNALVWINVLDPKGCITVWNKAAEQLSGYSKEEVQHNTAIWEWFYPDATYRAAITAKVNEIMQQGQEVVGYETRICTKSGEEKIIAWNSRRFFNAKGELLGSIAIGQDVTAQKEMALELQRLATHDFLTGLYNRREVMQRLEEDFARAKRYKRPLAILMVDVDHFKQVNDQFGHQAGDEVLSRFSVMLREAIRSVDYAGRYGGEEFILVLPEATADMAVEFAERLRKDVKAEPWHNIVQPLKTLTISVGVACYTEKTHSLDGLIYAADQALYQAKGSGRDQVCIASESNEFTTGFIR